MKTAASSKRKPLATSFTEAEVDLMDALQRGLREGKDVRTLARNPAMASLAAKFQKLREKAKGGAS